jgi:hypothetical protein
MDFMEGPSRDAPDSGGLDLEVLRLAADGLHADFGDLSDLPKELANTLANVYYRFFMLAPSATGQTMEERAMDLQREMLRQGDALEGYKKLMNSMAATEAGFRFAKDFIKAVRGARGKTPDFSRYLIVLTLDILKYDIDNANTKTPLRRAIERKFKKVDEIPDLLDIMGSHGFIVYSER